MSHPVVNNAWQDSFWFTEKVFFLLDQELNQIWLIQLIVFTKEHPCLADVVLTLLKGNLFSDGIGLISHLVLCRCIGIYGACDPGGRQWGPYDLRGWVACLEAVLIGTLCSYWYFQMGSYGVSVECPSDIAFGISVDGSWESGLQ